MTKTGCVSLVGREVLHIFTITAAGGKPLGMIGRTGGTSRIVIIVKINQSSQIVLFTKIVHFSRFKETMKNDMSGKGIPKGRFVQAFSKTLADGWK